METPLCGEIRSLGILGGTFDPVHNGHLTLAGAAKAFLHLDAVCFIPAADPPHKQARTITSFAMRLDMLQLATANLPGFLVSELEAKRRGPSYSIDTLKILSAQCRPETSFYFLMGTDAFLDMPTWKDFRDIPRYAHLVVVSRNSGNSRDFKSMVADKFSGYRYNSATHSWEHEESGNNIFYLAMEPVRVSSSAVRQMVKSGRDITDLVPENVARFIETHGLYLDDHT